MHQRRFLVFLVFCCLAVGFASAETYAPRQYYSGWNKHPTRSYYYRYLYYKPTASHIGYKHHYCLYYTSKPRHVYFYNPYKKTYWGRCAIDHKGKYSALAVADRRGSLKDIPESAFPTPTEPPPLPEVEDGIGLDLPPDDLPLD